MNIFVLDAEPLAAARAHCDKHVGKMLIEACQLMAGDWRHHPCSKWVRESRANFRWLFALARALEAEHEFRYGTRHGAGVRLKHLQPLEALLPDTPMTPHALAMPQHLKSSDAVFSYRRYYCLEKRRFARWERGRGEPSWWRDADCNH